MVCCKIHNMRNVSKTEILFCDVLIFHKRGWLSQLQSYHFIFNIFRCKRHLEKDSTLYMKIFLLNMSLPILFTLILHQSKKSSISMPGSRRWSLNGVRSVRFKAKFSKVSSMSVSPIRIAPTSLPS